MEGVCVTDLIPVTSLGATTPRSETVGSITITEITDRAIASVACLKGQSTALESAYAKLDRKTLPSVGKAIENNGNLAIWSSADEWLVDEDIHAHPNWSLELAERLGTTAAVTEQSGAWCRFKIECPDDTVEFFARICALDTAQMAQGDALRTTVHHLNCIIVKGKNDWLVTGPSSTAEDLYHALIVAARSVA